MKRNYQQAAHAMQAGVAFDQATGSQDGTPKHLRVGINVAMCDHAALVKLLIAKGIITDAEYREAILAEMNAEVERYEALLTQKMGKPIKLGSLE